MHFPIVNKRQRIPKRQSKTDNPEKLAAQSTQDEEKQNTIYVGHHDYAQTNTNNVKKTVTLLHTAGGEDEPHVVFYAEVVAEIITRKSERKSSFYMFMLNMLQIKKKYNIKY